MLVDEGERAQQAIITGNSTISADNIVLSLQAVMTTNLTIPTLPTAGTDVTVPS